jgi:hypothetical protein
MRDQADWPDTYVAVSGAIDDLGTVGAQTPADPDGNYDWLPFIRVTYAGGPDDGITTTPTVFVDVFADGRGAASTLAGKIRQRMLNGPHDIDGSALIDHAGTVAGPSEVPYGDTTKVRRYAATYQIQMRRYL